MSGGSTSGGKVLVIGAILVAIAMGGGAVLMRAGMRLRRGQDTARRVLDKLAENGLYKRDGARPAPPKPPVGVAALPFLPAAPRPVPGTGAGLAESIAAHARRRQATADFLEALGAAPLAVIDDPAALKTTRAWLEHIASPAAWSALLTRELDQGLAKLDEAEQRYAGLGFPTSLFRGAEAADIKASYLRYMGTAIETAPLDYARAEALTGMAADIARRQPKRTSAKELLLFPAALPEALNAEHLARTRARLLLAALVVLERGVTDAEAFKALAAEDPRLRDPCRQQTAETRFPLVFKAESGRFLLRSAGISDPLELSFRRGS